MPSPASVEPADDRGRDAARLAEHELGRAGELVGDRDLRRVQLVAGRVARAAQVEQRRMPGDADRDVGRPLPPRAAERVADDHADVAAGQLAQPARRRAAEASGSSGRSTTRPGALARSRRRRPPTRRRSRGASRRSRAAAATRTTRAVSRRITSSWRGSLVAGELARALGRLDLGERDDAALRLRDGLLRDDDDVAVLEPARALGGVGEQRREVVALLDLREALERDDPELAVTAGR